MLLVFPYSKHFTGQKIEERRARSHLREIDVCRFPEGSENKLIDNRKSQNGVDSALLQSSSMLGTGKPLTHQQRFEKDEDSQVRQAMLGRVGKRRRHSEVMDMMDSADDKDDKDEGLSDSDAETDDEPKGAVTRTSVEDEQMEVVNIQEAKKPPIPVVNMPVVIGSALRRNEDGTIAASAVRKRSKKVF
jgi:ATP-dependent RNA helicase DHX37/DHR1